jgi:hypothetical protein
MLVGDRLKGFFPESFSEFHHPLLVAGRIEVAPLTEKG